MAPDLLSFGVFHVTHPGWISLRLLGKISGPPALTLLLILFLLEGQAVVFTVEAFGKFAAPTPDSLFVTFIGFSDPPNA